MTGSTSDSKQTQPPQPAEPRPDKGIPSPIRPPPPVAPTDQAATARSGNSGARLDDPSVLEADQVCKTLTVDPARGLDEDEAARRLERFGPNELAGAPPVPAWRKFLQ